VGDSSILAPPPEAEVVRTSAGPVWIQDDGILRQVFEVKIVNVGHMEDIFAALLQLGGSAGNWRVLVDLRGVRWGTAASREFAAGKSLAQLVDAQAIVVGSSVSRMLASFFIRVSHPPFPTRVFISAAIALEWLRSTRSVADARASGEVS
jgi:hypothetical protein